MRRTKLILTIILVMFSFSQLYTKTKISDLAPKYRKWLKEEVTYIITKQERRIFLELETDRERDMFIQAFWKNRDPNPNTPENEFKTEHYRRIEYANDKLGKGTPTAGWRTEMGRIYIILGEPHYIERHENETQIYPLIIWFYQGLVKYGLPNAFNVVFFKRDGTGDYVLYSPIVHGPHSLLVNYFGDVTDYLRAYNELRAINPNVANVSLSLVEGEQTTALKPSLSSDILIQKKIPQAPTEKIDDVWASKLLKYKEYIDVDYSVNYIPNSAMVKVIRDKSGYFFVHYLIEPTKLSIEQYDEDYFANLEINGSVLDKNNKTIYEFKKSIPIKLQEEQLNKIRSKLFSFQDIFPLIEGEYTINILVRNVVSKEFTSIERTVKIPETKTTRMSSITLAHTARKNPKYLTVDKSFKINDVQLLPSPKNDFVTGDKLYVYFQVYGLTDEDINKGYITYTLYKRENAIHTMKKNLTEYPDEMNILEEFSMERYTAAYYNIKAEVYGADEKLLTSGEESFYITPSKYLPRPWVVSLSSPAGSPEILNKLGIQYENSHNNPKALEYLRKAYNKNPLSSKLALDYSRILNKLKLFQKVIDVGTPFLETEHKTKFYPLMGIASQELGQYEQAITYFKDYLSYYGTNIRILNLIGNCYHKLGKIDEALVAWEKSLELMPKQEKLKTLVETLKKNHNKPK
jgi:GWxTD domain-containing protein